MDSRSGCYAAQAGAGQAHHPLPREISGTWEPDEAERRAAWELCVELITRVAVVKLGTAEGLLREAL